MIRSRLAVIVGLALLSASIRLDAQVNNPAYRDYLLVGRFGEICTMCEAIVRCDANVADSFTLYHFQTRTFWSQISTIWEWFVANFDSDSLARGGHTRPVHIYAIDNGRWGAKEIVEAHLSLDPARISLLGTHIERDTFVWRTGDRSIGQCKRLPLWETLEIIDERHG